jgi:hypothetical protein
VVIGRCCILCGQVGIAGSATYVAHENLHKWFCFAVDLVGPWLGCYCFGAAKLGNPVRYVSSVLKQEFVCRLGDYVVMGGKSGIADHVSVASKVMSISRCCQ